MFKWIITSFTLGFLSLSSAYGAADKGEYCTKMKGELDKLQKSELSLTSDTSGRNLIALQKAYDAAIAEYTIYKGIEDLRNSYLKFNKEVTGLDLGDKKSSDGLSMIQNFFKGIFGGKPPQKLKDIQEFRQEIRDGMTATAGILVMEDLLDQIMDNKNSLQVYLDENNMRTSEDDFLSAVKTRCDMKDNMEASSLCKELFKISTKGTNKGQIVDGDNSHAREMVLGFYNTYKVLLKNSDDKKAVKSSLADYKKTLLTNLPKSGYMKDQLEVAKKVDENIGKRFDTYRTDLKTNPEAPIPDQDVASIMTDVKEFFNGIGGLSKRNDQLLGKSEKDALEASTTSAVFKDKFGDISELINDMGKGVDGKHQELINKMLAYQNLSEKRHNLAFGHRLDEDYEETTAPEMYQKLFGELGEFAQECGHVSYSSSIKHRKEERGILYKCLDALGKLGKDDPIAKRISAAKKRADENLAEIKKIENSDAHENLNFLKHVIADNYKNTCRGGAIETCVPDNYRQGIFSQEFKLNFLVDDAQNVIADLDTGLQKFDPKSKHSRLVKLCEDTYYSSMSSVACKPTLNFEKTKMITEEFRFDEGIGDKSGMRVDPKMAPTTAGMIVDSLNQPVNEFANFFMQYQWTDNTVGYLQNQAMAKKTYNYAMEKQWEQWYGNPMVQAWGVNGMYPNFYNPLTSTTFGYGSTGTYFGSTGYSFAN